MTQIITFPFLSCHFPFVNTSSMELIVLINVSLPNAVDLKVSQEMREQGIERSKAMDLVRIKRLIDACDSKEDTALYLLEEWNYEPQVRFYTFIFVCFSQRTPSHVLCMIFEIFACGQQSNIAIEMILFPVPMGTNLGISFIIY